MRRNVPTVPAYKARRKNRQVVKVAVGVAAASLRAHLPDPAAVEQRIVEAMREGNARLLDALRKRGVL